MSTLLPSKTANVVNVLVPYLRHLTYRGMLKLLEFCRMQSAVFRNTALDSTEHKDARDIVFTLCKQLRIAPLFPQVFYTCVCEASDIIATEEHTEPLLYGCTILA